MGMPSRARILDFWREWLEESGIDLLEPQCWCCFRIFRNARSFLSLAKKDNPSWTEIRSAWNAFTDLHRCHIVAQALAGTDEPENLFLMCKRCHDRAPDTTSKEMFLRWVSAQNEGWAEPFTEAAHQTRQALQDFGVDSDEKMGELTTLLESREFKAWARRNMTIHLGPYGGTLKPSTMVAALLQFRNQHNRQIATRSVQEQLRFPFDDR